MHLQMVECAVKHARIPERTCALRYQNANANRGRYGRRPPGWDDFQCRDCPVGERLYKEGKHMDDGKRVQGKKDPVREEKRPDQGRNCTKCGRFLPWDRFYIDSRSATGHKARCKECEKAAKRKQQKRSRNKAAVKTGKAARPSAESHAVRHEDAPGDRLADGSGYLLIDFSRYPEVFSALCAEAEKDLRTPDMQALYIIRRVVSG